MRIQEVTDDIAEGPGDDGRRAARWSPASTEKGPAAAAGIVAGDVILEFDGQTVDAMHELPRIVADEPVGKEVQVKVLRKGKEQTLTVKLGRLEEAEKAAGRDGDSGDAAPTSEPPPTVVDRPARPDALRPVAGDSAPSTASRTASRGVVVTEVADGSAAAEKRLQPGDVIVEIAQEPVVDRPTTSTSASTA